jgi:putative transposase
MCAYGTAGGLRRKQRASPTLHRIKLRLSKCHSDLTPIYCPQWPAQGFASLAAARVWVQDFIAWYNHQHRHSRIRFVTPAQRHRGDDKAILQKRHAVYEAAKAKHPERWSGKTRNWEPIGAVMLNPERPALPLSEAA